MNTTKETEKQVENLRRKTMDINERNNLQAAHIAIFSDLSQELVCREELEKDIDNLENSANKAHFYTDERLLDTFDGASAFKSHVEIEVDMGGRGISEDVLFFATASHGILYAELFYRLAR